MTTAIGDIPGERRVYNTREEWHAALEQQRREAIRDARLYYSGRQYDEDNEQCLREWMAGHRSGEKSLARSLFEEYQLPEHLRRHAYSTQIGECVDWIADRLATGFAVESSPASVQQIIDGCLTATPELAAGDEDSERNVTLILREAGTCGDVAVLVRWDAAEGTCWLEFFDPEQVDVTFAAGRPDQLDQVTVYQIDWRFVQGAMQQVTLRRVWTLDTGTCVERVYLDGDATSPDVDAEPVETHDWGLPFLPWALLRMQRANLRATRGASLISAQAMRTADRYNSVEQISWLIARYNSHGNLAVVGDTVMVAEGDKPIHKDVADVLRFPGGTGLHQISLSTDPAMIEHQKQVLGGALYELFGLRRIDQESVTNLGQVSGYALELLNQRSENTFSRIRAQLVKDFKALFNLVVDAHLTWSAGTDTRDVGATVGGGDADAGLSTSAEGAAQLERGQRTITVRLGSGWVADEANARDNYLAGAISRREFLRIIGRDDDDIDRIVNEIAEETSEQTQPGETGRFATPESAPASTQAGRTLTNVTTGRREPGLGELA